ncbi:MAG: mycothiol synthase [Actinomycetia bacterium]|nr:mycothiol synthase [Actinomycetes bacterium]
MTASPPLATVRYGLPDEWRTRFTELAGPDAAPALLSPEVIAAVDDPQEPTALAWTGVDDRGTTLLELTMVGDRPITGAEAVARAVLGELTDRRVDRWAHPASAADDELALRLGLHPDRALHQMRCPLPLDRSSLAVRTFVPGSADEDSWLAVNNRAFAWHPDQGGWDIGRLHGQMAEDWFDAEGFLLHERDGRLAGFCWTKVHPASEADPAMGEIYVIAVDPDFHGQGLGRPMTLAGFDWLADQGLDVGMLYVEATNDAAVATYHGIGMHIHETHKSWTTAGPPPQLDIAP